jgi:transposase-like protein
MWQHFLLSAKARTLSLAKVLRLSDDEAFATFRDIRWADTGGEPYCPKCGCDDLYTITTRKLWKCKGCASQFSVTSGTIFASRKLPIRDILAAIAIFVNGAKGYAALQLSRDLDVQYKTAFVLSHKIREAIAAEQERAVIDTEAAVDGAYFGGYVKPANRKADRIDRRLAMHRTGKRQVVIVARELNGETRTHIAKSEADGVAFAMSTVAPGVTVHADEAFVIGAIIELRRCLDLSVRENGPILTAAYESLAALYETAKKPLPENKKAPLDQREDKVMRLLDCAVINHLAENAEQPFDTVRGLFVEGDKLYPGAEIFHKSHAEIAVRNSACIRGVFIPM